MVWDRPRPPGETDEAIGVVVGDDAREKTERTRTKPLAAGAGGYQDTRT